MTREEAAIIVKTMPTTKEERDTYLEALNLLAGSWATIN